MVGPLPYIGGKNRLAKRIIEVFPEHRTYIEPFAGGAQVLFHKAPSEVEVLNDVDGEVVRFFRVCQSHYEELIRYLRFVVVSREWFDLLRKTDPEGLTDVQRAARFLYLQKCSFAGIVARPSYKRHIVQPPTFNVERLPKLIENTHKRLQRVQIENAPYEDILHHFDSPRSLFFADPPYFAKKLYRFNFERKDFEQLSARLGHLKGKFVLSLNDVPEVRKIFRSFFIRSLEVAYSAQQASGRRYREVLITNFRLQ